jgi:hypothetical protein
MLSGFTFLCFILQSGAQENALRTFGKWDIGVLGTWLNIEYPLARNITAMSEIGLSPVIFGGYERGSGVLLSGRLRQGVRLYYNRTKRMEKGRNLRHNSGNYFGFDVDYQPPGLYWTSDQSRSVIREFRAMPTFGLRRAFGKRMVIDGHLGIGYGYSLGSNIALPHNMVYDFRISVGVLLFQNEAKH